MTSERSLWSTARRHLSAYGQLQRIESPLVIGIPDVCYCLLGHTGWLELKELDKWPVRPTTPVRIASLIIEQVIFAESWRRAGGAAHLLLQVGRAYVLLDASMMRRIFNRSAIRAEVELSALARGERVFPASAVVRALTR